VADPEFGCEGGYKKNVLSRNQTLGIKNILHSLLSPNGGVGGFYPPYPP